MRPRDKQTNKQKQKTYGNLNNTVDQFDLSRTYRMPSLRVDYIYFFKCIPLLTKIDYRLGHKVSLNKYQALKSFRTLSDHNDIKPEIQDIEKIHPNI